jgi:uncharacterized membrane protein
VHEPIDDRMRRLEERLARLEARLGMGEPADDVLGNLAYRKRVARQGRDVRDPGTFAGPTPDTLADDERPFTGGPPVVGGPPAVVVPPVVTLPPVAGEPPLAAEAPVAEWPAGGWQPVAPSPLPVAAAAARHRPPIERVPPGVRWDPVPADGVPVADYAPAPPPWAAVPQGDLERAIGLKWAGWFGAAVLVVGAALSIKYAYDEGWLTGLPDVAKLLLMSLGGFALIAAGEAVLRRVNRLSAAGLYGAGVAVLFLVGYAGHAWYGVYAQGSAFGLMALATVVGVLLAARADLVSVAVLSLLGGHGAPILLATDVKAVAPFLAYLLLLQLLALALCHWRASGKWWTLRTLSLAATAAWELAVAWPPDRPVATVSAFAVLYAVLFQLELVLTTLRVARRRGPAIGVSEESPAVPPRVPPHVGGPRPAVPWWRPVADPNAGLLFSMFATAQFVLVVLVNLADASRVAQGAWVLATAAACAAAGTAMLARRPALGRLSLSLRAQAAALVVLAVPVLVDRQNVVFGWLALAVAFAAVGAKVRTRLARVAAAVTWGLAVVALIGWATDDGLAGDPASAMAAWLSVAGVDLTGALVVAFAAAIGGHAVAVLGDWASTSPAAAAAAETAAERPSAVALPPSRRPDQRPGGGWPIDSAPAANLDAVVHALSGLVWAVAAVRLLAPVPGTVGLLVYAGLLWAASGWPAARWPALRSLAYLSAAAVLSAAVKWVGFDLLVDRLSAHGPARPLFNAHVLNGVLIAAATAGVGWTRRAVLLPRSDPAAVALFRSALTAAVALLLTIGLTAEVPALVADGGPAGGGVAAGGAVAGPAAYGTTLATQLAWTMLWASAAAAVLAIDRLVIRPPAPTVARLAAAALLATAAKHVVLDAVALRLLDGPAAVAVVFNAQVLAAAVVAGGLVLSAVASADRSARSAARTAAVLVVLVAGSVEVDRFAVQLAAEQTWIVRQAGWSVWWSLFAVGCVVAGFAVRSAELRVAGLALFGLTLGKVVLVDLAGVGTGWRIVSFLGLGLLLLGTSVLYGRYGATLLKDGPDPSAE